MTSNTVRTTSFARPTLEQLRQRAIATINDKLPGVDATLRNSVLDVLSAVVADMANELYGYLDYIADQVIIDTASDEYLDRWGLVWGITRKLASFATGTILVFGTQGSVLPAGKEFTRGDMVFVTESSALIPANGSVEIDIKAKKVGLSGNTPADAKLSLTSPVAGIISEAVVGEMGITGGTERESNEDYLARVLARIQNPPHGGSKTDWEQWTLEVPGVTRAWCYPLEMGPGTVGIRFMMDNIYEDGIPEAGDVQHVADYLNTYDRKPVTAHVYVNAPIPQLINVEIANLAKDTPEVRQAISAELTDLFAREAYPGCTVYISKIWEAISVATGVNHFDLVSPAANMQMPASTIPILGEVTYTELKNAY